MVGGGVEGPGRVIAPVDGALTGGSEVSRVEMDSPDMGRGMSTRMRHLSSGSAALEQGVGTGRMVLSNALPIAVWHLTATTSPGSVHPESDLLSGTLVPGGGEEMKLPEGLYRFVAETGEGGDYRSPFIYLDAGGVARWSIGRDA